MKSSLKAKKEELLCLRGGGDAEERTMNLMCGLKATWS